MSNQHKSFRRVLKVSKFKNGPLSVVQILWCIVREENSRSVFTDHLAVSTYVDGVKNTGISARMSSKTFRVSKKEPLIDKAFLDESFTQAYWNSLEGAKLNGTIVWFDTARGVGYVRSEQLASMLPVYACNVKGANHSHHELVTNIDLKDKDQIEFTLGDCFTTKNCGAIQVRKVG